MSEVVLEEGACLDCGEVECLCDGTCSFCDEPGHIYDNCPEGMAELEASRHDPDDPFYDPIRDMDGYGFADPGGHSALREATWGDCPKCRGGIDEIDDYCRHCGHKLNPRKFPCPTCGSENRLTRVDNEHRYQCNSCADAMERGIDIF